MKLAILSLLAGSAAAFSPATKSVSPTALNVSPALEKMVGTSVESPKIVSVLFTSPNA